MAAEMSSQAVPLPNATVVGTLAPATVQAFSNNNTDNAYPGPLFPQSEARDSLLTFCPITYLFTLQDLAISRMPCK